MDGLGTQAGMSGDIVTPKIFRSIAEGNNACLCSANDEVTFMGFVDDGMNRSFFLTEGSTFTVRKVG